MGPSAAWFYERQLRLHRNWKLEEYLFDVFRGYSPHVSHFLTCEMFLLPVCLVLGCNECVRCRLLLPRCAVSLSLSVRQISSASLCKNG